MAEENETDEKTASAEDPALQDDDREDETDEDIDEEDVPLSFCHACLTPFEQFYYLGEKNGFSLVSCLQCTTAVADPYPTVEFMEKYFEKFKKPSPKSEEVEKAATRHLKTIQKLQEKTKGKRFLSVGCGYGYSVIAAHSAELEAYGIDVEEKPIKLAKKNLGKEYFRRISVEDYAAGGKQADIVYIAESQIFECALDPNAFAAALKKILAPGGVIYLDILDGNHFMVPSNFIRWKDVKPPVTLHYFSRKGIKILLERHGLEVERFKFRFRTRMSFTAVHASEKTAKDKKPAKNDGKKSEKKDAAA